MSDKLNSSLDTLFSKMESFITTKTVVGEAIHMGGVIIVPLVDVTFGVGAGGGEGEKEKGKSAQSGGGMGGKISPSAVLVIVDGNVQLVSIKNQDSINKLIDLVPGLISKLNLGSMFKKSNNQTTENESDRNIDVTIKETIVKESE